MIPGEKGKFANLVDIQPTRFDLNPIEALGNASRILERMNIPTSSIKAALGLVIPNLEQAGKILYGLRNQEYHREYPNTWGLPSISMSQEEFLQLDKERDTVVQVVNRLSKAKLSGISLTPITFVGWTGRLRLSWRDPQFEESYYLIMVDLKTEGMDPKLVPASTPAYLELKWLTPEEHAAVIATTPTRACGACSQLVRDAQQHRRL